jgi:hypothetical protein
MNYEEINELMKKEGMWVQTQNLEIYTADEFISEFGDKMSPKLKNILKQYVSRLQKYFDSHIIELK